MKHSCEVWLKLTKWKRSCHLKEIVDDAQQISADPNSSL